MPRIYVCIQNQTTTQSQSYTTKAGGGGGGGGGGWREGQSHVLLGVGERGGGSLFLPLYCGYNNLLLLQALT